MKWSVVPPDGEDAFLLLKCNLLILEDREELTDRDTSDSIELLC